MEKSIEIVILSSGFTNVADRAVFASEYYNSPVSERPGSGYDKSVHINIHADSIVELEGAIEIDGILYTGCYKCYNRIVLVSFSPKRSELYFDIVQ